MRKAKIKRRLWNLVGKKSQGELTQAPKTVPSGWRGGWPASDSEAEPAVTAMRKQKKTAVIIFN